ETSGGAIESAVEDAGPAGVRQRNHGRGDHPDLAGETGAFGGGAGFLGETFELFDDPFPVAAGGESGGPHARSVQPQDMGAAFSQFDRNPVFAGGIVDIGVPVVAYNDEIHRGVNYQILRGTSPGVKPIPMVAL